MATLQCRIVNAREALCLGKISILIATDIEGEIGIQPSHTPLITLLKPVTEQYSQTMLNHPHIKTWRQAKLQEIQVLKITKQVG